MSLNPRKSAVEILYNIIKSKKSLSDEINNLRNREGISSLDIRFVSEIVNGVMRNLEFIDYAVSLSSNIRITKIAPYVMCILRVGVYQILFMDKVPASAAVNESVKLTKSSSNRHLSGFVNAVLRSVERKGINLPLPDDEIKRNSILYSCPLWLTDIYKELLYKDYVSFLKASSGKAPTILRVNKLRTTADELCNILNSEGWSCKKLNSSLVDDVDCLLIADKIVNLTESAAYKEGLFYVQDSAAAYTAMILNPKPGSTVLDMCASPGGKTTHMAEIMNNTGKIYGFDVSEQKAEKIRQNSTRLGIDIIETRIGDSAVYNPEFENKADYILVDAPCSGLGIVRKKPDIKYIRTPDDISKLAKISLSILDTSAGYLKSGGTMVFSTCTLMPQENEDVLFAFLDTHKDFHLKEIPCNKANDGYITLFPHVDECDGFFISLMIKE